MFWMMTRHRRSVNGQHQLRIQFASYLIRCSESVRSKICPTSISYDHLHPGSSCQLFRTSQCESVIGISGNRGRESIRIRYEFDWLTSKTFPSLRRLLRLLQRLARRRRRLPRDLTHAPLTPFLLCHPHSYPLRSKYPLRT